MYDFLYRILATNRDEFLHRPTEDAHWHSFEQAAAAPPLPHAHAQTHAQSNAITKKSSTADTFLPSQGPTSTSHSHSSSASTTLASTSSQPLGSILSGRDLQAGGTWLGLSRAGGRIALLTNITEPLAKWKISRGDLCAGFLTMEDRRQGKGEEDKTSGQDILNQWEDKMGVNEGGGAGEYAGFNLLLLAPRVESGPQSHTPSENGDGEKARVVYDARFVTNHGGGGPLASRPLSSAERECGGISNGVDHSQQNKQVGKEEEEVTNDAADEWPKVRRARGDFAKLLQVQADNPEDLELSEDDLVERLFGILDWHPTPSPVAHRGELRNTVHVLPVRLSLPSVVSKGTDPVHNSETAPTSTTAPDIKAAQLELTVSRPGSTTAPGTASALMNVQGSTDTDIGPTNSTTQSTTKPKTNLKAETPPAFYGTRLATVVLVPRDPAREALFVERDIWALGVGVGDPDPDLALASGRDLRDSGAEEGPVKVDKSRQRVFRFMMDFGDSEK
ncbi:hypothetical protein D9619_012674 [Psilocybe cf. subviscida]|uniref:Uncharacterized protein n=1 Tax=Psilocybe cf. subviscida TaxID=2480587 RepID=A0A8H5EZA9_9AGAR|nr:hypothetical protein D9619_012674 [Psilocybe cf. subviscida]